MIKNLTDLRKIVALARKNGIERLKIGTTEIVFSQMEQKEPNSSVDANPRMNSQIGAPIQSWVSGERPPSDDELLFLSTPHFDELRAEREAAKNPPKEERN